MYTGTTNLVAAAQEKDRGVDGKPATTKNFIAALQLSGFVGTALGTALFALAVPVLRSLIGNSSMDPEVFSAALKYVRIRALGMPAAAIIGSSQAACLGMQDIKSPLYVLLAAAVVNFFGDVSLVANPHHWIGGAAGAAWATVFSQYAAVFLFVQWLCHLPDETKPKRWAFLTRRFEKKKKKKAATESRDDHPRHHFFSTRGFLEGKFRGRYFFRLPSMEKISDFTPYIVPVTSTQIGRVSSYLAMSHVISSSLGTANMAAQQVIICTFWMLFLKVSRDRYLQSRLIRHYFYYLLQLFGTACIQLVNL
jgi:peptidoglycan biosynthesis protein MviN/MurJ (putative lipid II flippase)